MDIEKDNKIATGAGALNVMCCICSEFYKSNDIVYCTTACGHIFHRQCINNWLERSSTCPQCRSICHPERIHRIYFNFGERTAEDDLPPPINPIQWLPLDLGARNVMPIIPQGAIKVGTDPDGNDTYVARAYFNGDLVPASYAPKKKGAYVPFCCQAHLVRDNIEILVDVECKWMPEDSGDVPVHAINTGYTDQGENLYTGRAKYKGITLLGKIHPSHGVLYMPYRGSEINVPQYEVLVYAPRNQTKSK